MKVRPDAKERNARYAGSYRALRHSYTKAEKVLAAFGDFGVAAMPDGTLMFRDLLEANPTKWVEVGDGVFRQQLDDTFVAFVGGDGGKATHMLGPFAPIAFVRVAWYESPMLHGVLILIGVALFISILVSAIRRRKADRAGTPKLRWARFALARSGRPADRLPARARDQRCGWHRRADLRVPHRFLCRTRVAAAGFDAHRAGRSTTPCSCGELVPGRSATRVHYSATLVSVLLFFWVLSYWNLIGYRFG